MSRDGVREMLKDSIAHLMVFIGLVAGALFAIYLCTGFYTIEQNTIGVLQLFGKVIDDNVEPGIHYALPWPVSRVNKITVKTEKAIEISHFARIPLDNGSETGDSKAPTSSPVPLPASRDPGIAYRDLTGLAPYCITGDNNIVNISLVIKYDVTDPKSYLFNVKDPEALLTSAAATAVVHYLASRPVDEILTKDRDLIASEVADTTQQRLGAMDAGITISRVELRYVSPPESVQPYFDDVINARVEKIRLLDLAESYRNKKILRAESEAYTIKQKAESYRQETLRRAQGEAKRFLTQLEEYRKAPTISRKRIYLDFMRVICPKLDHIIAVDNSGREKPITITVMPE